MNKFEAVILFSPDLSNPIINKEEDQFNKREINVYQDDTLIDLFLRLQDLELKMMIEYLDKLRDGKHIKYKKLGEGKRYRSVPWEIEKNLFKEFQMYKNNY